MAVERSFQMRILRVAGVMIALAAALVAGPVRADDPGLSLQLAMGWDGAATAGAWIPYQVSLRDDNATRDFSGSLVIRPAASGPAAGGGSGLSGFAGSTSGTIYQQAVTVRRASQKVVTIYGAYEAGAAGGGFLAELVDRSGAVVARSPLATVIAGRFAVGLLSDSLQAGGQIKDTQVQGASNGVVQFSSQGFPAGALLLSGLGAVVIDNFDTSSLSQSQGQALEQYVGLGGQLVLAGGNGWRRTLTQLPPALVPLRPQGSVPVALEPLLDLFAQHSTLIAPSVVGVLAPGARIVLADAGGNPLLAEMAYGAGRVVEVAFDPADEPVASHPAEVSASWAAVLGRIVPTPPPTFLRQVGAGVVLAPQGGPVAFSPSRSALDDAVSALLNDTPANSLPPLGILGGLLVLYILVAGPLNYALLRLRRRRELMWVTVPLIAVLFTAGADAGGILVHGRDYYVNEIQILRVAPSGAIDIASYDAVFSPSRGNVAVQLATNTLAATYLPATAGLGQGGDDRVLTGGSPLVDLRDLAVWSPRDLKTEAPARGTIVVEAHLRLEQGRIRGTVTNRGLAAIRKLTLLATDGSTAAIAARLAPGSAITVDAALKTKSTQGSGPSIVCNAGAGCVAPAPAPTDKEGSILAATAAATVSPSAQVQSLAGIVDGLPGFRIGGLLPTRSVTAAFAMPLSLESVDSLLANWSAPRVVAANSLNANPVSVLEYQLPPMPAAAQLKLSAGTASIIGSTPVPGQRTVGEIYDWTSGNWSSVDFSHPFQVSPGMRGPGLVRIRIQGSLFLQGLQISSP
jgi:hypothetical protein